MANAAEQAYATNKARQYNQNLNTAAIEAAIDEFATKSVAAFKYNLDILLRDVNQLDDDFQAAFNLSMGLNADGTHGVPRRHSDWYRHHRSR